MAVYLEFGVGLPRNGGEKNYLEFVYTKPKFLVTGFYVRHSTQPLSFRWLTLHRLATLSFLAGLVPTLSPLASTS